jgi:hypothetical protein
MNKVKSYCPFNSSKVSKSSRFEPLCNVDVHHESRLCQPKNNGNPNVTETIANAPAVIHVKHAFDMIGEWESIFSGKEWIPVFTGMTAGASACISASVRFHSDVGQATLPAGTRSAR